MNHPWTTGAPQLAYSTEAVLWGAFIEQHVASSRPATARSRWPRWSSTTTSAAYDAGFKAVIAQSPTLKDEIDYKTEKIEPRRRRSPTP